MSKQLRPVRNAHLDHKVCATAGCNFMVSEKSRLRAGRCIGFHEKVKRLCTAPSKSLPVLRGDACRETQTLPCAEPLLVHLTQPKCAQKTLRQNRCGVLV